MANKKPDPNSPTYHKPIMAGRECSAMAGSTAWLAKREEKQT